MTLKQSFFMTWQSAPAAKQFLVATVLFSAVQLSTVFGINALNFCCKRCASFNTRIADSVDFLFLFCVRIYKVCLKLLLQ